MTLTAPERPSNLPPPPPASSSPCQEHRGPEEAPDPGLPRAEHSPGRAPAPPVSQAYHQDPQQAEGPGLPRWGLREKGWEPGPHRRSMWPNSPHCPRGGCPPNPRPPGSTGDPTGVLSWQGDKACTSAQGVEVLLPWPLGALGPSPPLSGPSEPAARRRMSKQNCTP